MQDDTDWTLIDFTDPRSIPKGECPKCGRHIGRGIAKHVKGCNGDDHASDS